MLKVDVGAQITGIIVPILFFIGISAFIAWKRYLRMVQNNQMNSVSPFPNTNDDPFAASSSAPTAMSNTQPAAQSIPTYGQQFTPQVSRCCTFGYKLLTLSVFCILGSAVESMHSSLIIYLKE